MTDHRPPLDFENLYRAYFRRVLALLIKYAPSEAEDLASDVFMRTWERWARLTWTAEAEQGAYLFRAARNLLINRHRRLNGAEFVEDPDTMLGQMVAGDAPDLIERAFMRELLRVLTPRQVQVLDLHVVRGFTHAEVGRRLGVKRDSVTKIQRRALRHMQKYALSDPMASNFVSRA
ncbi:MAG: sigma-70 family RNA polymerase sigma factor [Chloroflexi bacterium]|nr:sigma-70 family RNA polymerase sigma factor [Chloroflexota bacterium]